MEQNEYLGDRVLLGLKLVPRDKTKLDQFVIPENSYIPNFIEIVSSSSSAYVRPLLDIGLSHGTPLSTILSQSHPALASRPAKIIAPPSLRTSYATPITALHSQAAADL
ncbi:hypothetical protein MSG28_003538 [Choristoneura fumiferana]|uniref:Uncharacterized protein n=1 Tax=Choristoneura fumiferana TaxID=7141 RepID=A0ACC0KFG4_CHOFU|nr:hypothetical protein MSG28_003538 [Choristoneura fumiferana]